MQRRGAYILSIFMTDDWTNVIKFASLKHDKIYHTH